MPLVAPSSYGGIIRAKQTKVGMYRPLAWPTIDNGDTSASQAMIKSVEANVHQEYLTRGNVPTMDLDVDKLRSQDLVDWQRRLTQWLEESCEEVFGTITHWIPL